MPSSVPSVLFGSSGVHTTFLETAVAFANIQDYWALFFFMLEAISTLSCPFMKIQKAGVPRLGFNFIYFVIVCFCD
jgi:hypothetical protein